MTGKVKNSTDSENSNSKSQISESEIELETTNFYPSPPAEERVFSPAQMNMPGMDYNSPGVSFSQVQNYDHYGYSHSQIYGHPPMLQFDRLTRLHMQIYSKHFSAIKCCAVFDIFTSILVACISQVIAHYIWPIWYIAVAVSIAWLVMAISVICSVKPDAARQTNLFGVKRYKLIRSICSMAAILLSIVNIIAVVVVHKKINGIKHNTESESLSVAIYTILLFIMTMFSTIMIFMSAVGLCLNYLYDKHLRILLKNEESQQINIDMGFVNN